MTSPRPTDGAHRPDPDEFLRLVDLRDREDFDPKPVTEEQLRRESEEFERRFQESRERRRRNERLFGDY